MQPHVFVLVFANGESRIRASSSPAAAFRQWRHRHGDFLAVTAMALSAEAFTSITGRSLPAVITTAEAARHFGRTRPSHEAFPFIVTQIKRLGDKAPALLLEWQSAVDSVKGVAA